MTLHYDLILVLGLRKDLPFEFIVKDHIYKSSRFVTIVFYFELTRLGQTLFGVWVHFLGLIA